VAHGATGGPEGAIPEAVSGGGVEAEDVKGFLFRAAGGGQEDAVTGDERGGETASGEGCFP